MSDYSELKKLLWSEVAAWSVNCESWQKSSEALAEFLGKKTVEEVALDLLVENEALRKDAERYRWLRRPVSGHVEVVEWIGPHATGMLGEDLDALLDGVMSKRVQP